MQKKQNGFSLVEIIIVIGVVLVLLGIGQYVYRNRQKSQTPNSATGSEAKTAQNQASSTQNPDNGAIEWKQTILEKEKIKLKYPSTWNLANSSSASQDKVKLASGGLTLFVTTGNEQISGFCASCKLIKAEPITVLGQAVFLNFITTTNSKDPNKIQLSFNDACAGTCGIEGKNILMSGVKTIITAEIYYQKTSGELVSTPLSTYSSDPNYQIAKEIIKSFSY